MVELIHRFEPEPEIDLSMQYSFDDIDMKEDGEEDEEEGEDEEEEEEGDEEEEHEGEGEEEEEAMEVEEEEVEAEAEEQEEEEEEMAAEANEEDDSDAPDLDIWEPTLEDLEELRYKFYQQNGLDDENIRPISEVWLRNIWKLVPTKYQTENPELVQDLEDEITEDYRNVVKAAMVDFLVHEPDRRSAAQLDSGPLKDEMLRRVPKPWRGSVILAKKKLLRNLHAYHPVLAYINFMWRAVFR